MIRRSVRRGVGGGLGLFVFFLTGNGIFGASAWADDADTQVTVIRPTGGDEVLAEIATRAWAELNAGGVPARLVDCGDDADGCRTPPAPPGGRAITLTTFRRSDETITEATLTPDGHDRPTVRRSLTVSDEAAADPKVMAIRAVELVNALLLQLDSTVAESTGERRGGIADPEFPGHHIRVGPPSLDGSTDQERWTAGAGGVFLKGPGGLHAAFGFAVRVGYTFHRRVGVAALLVEAPLMSETSTLNGEFSLNQQLAALEITCRVYQNARVSSHVVFGGGAYHANASWTGTSASVLGTPANSSATLWALLISGGGGAVLAVGGDISLFAEARAVLATPSPVVYTTDLRALKTADPSLLLSLGLQRTF